MTINADTFNYKRTICKIHKQGSNSSYRKPYFAVHSKSFLSTYSQHVLRRNEHGSYLFKAQCLLNAPSVLILSNSAISPECTCVLVRLSE